MNAPQSSRQPKSRWLIPVFFGTAILASGLGAGFGTLIRMREVNIMGHTIESPLPFIGGEESFPPRGNWPVAEDTLLDSPSSPAYVPAAPQQADLSDTYAAPSSFSPGDSTTGTDVYGDVYLNGQPFEATPGDSEIKSDSVYGSGSVSEGESVDSEEPAAASDLPFIEDVAPSRVSDPKAEPPEAIAPIVPPPVPPPPVVPPPPPIAEPVSPSLTPPEPAGETNTSST
ncbi:MAG: hypothetical protein AAF889_03915 [Cyanobacteria bacterium P01_D01_bin.73]